MRRTLAIGLATLVIGAAALQRYLARDYRPDFARAAGELVQVRDSTEIGWSRDGKRLTEVTLRSDTDLEARVRVRAPGDRTGQRHPAAILIGGFETGRRVVDVPADSGPLILVGVDYPYDGPVWPEGLQWVRYLVPLRSSLIEMPSAILLAAQYTYTREDVDPDRVMIIGASLGAPFAAAAAATDRRLTGAALLHGGADIRSMARSAFEARLGRWRAEAAAVALAVLLAPLEPSKYAGAIAPRPTLVIAAKEDERIASASRRALIEAVREPRDVVWLDTRHVGSRRVEIVESLLQTTFEWMTRRGLLDESS